MNRVFHFSIGAALRSRVGFAAVTYLAVGVLTLSFLAGLVVTGTRPPEVASPPQATPEAAEVDVTVQHLAVDQEQPTPPSPVTTPEASPTPEPAPASGQPVVRTFRPRVASPKPVTQPPSTPVVAKAQIGITDGGIYPKDVAIVPGGTITWINQGSAIHTATRAPGTGYRLDTGGLAAGQSYSLTLFDPGTYHYTSAPDCLATPTKPGFDCSDATIHVVAPARPLAVTAQAAANVPSQVAVAITDAGFVPDVVAVKANGVVQWTNEGSSVHTATATSQSRQFDSGGLAMHQTTKATFTTPGTYSYTSAPDCLHGNKSATFNCGATFTVVVTA